MLDPTEQFQILQWISIQLGPIDISFTNISLFLILTALVAILVIGVGALSNKTMVPGRFQALIEIGYQALYQTAMNQLGKDTAQFFPYIFSLFMFVFVANLVGLIPGFYTVTSQLIITLTLAVLVFGFSLSVGIRRHGTRFFRVFFPQNLPGYMVPLIIPVEILSFLSRPISLGVRLFANMVAGHIMIKLFTGFSVQCWQSAAFSFLGIIPLGVNGVMFGFELMVAILQAYVFMVLTCIYLRDALELH
jgi:F-type H+-transporting ATPase subunit a